MDALKSIGWTEEFAQKWEKSRGPYLEPARVIADFGTSLTIATPDFRPAQLSGKLAHYSNTQIIPKVGDWVAVRLLDNSPAVIEAVLPRVNEFARKVAGRRTMKQVVATNIDIAFILVAPDEDFSIERMRRYVYQLSAAHITTVIILNKADKVSDYHAYSAQLDALKCRVIIASAVSGMGIDDVRNHIAPARTAILLGSSGVGKSTLTNKLLGRDVQRTQAVRATDATGKHTTVHRELFILPNGGLLIDTPGIRELQLWGTSEDLHESYEDILVLAQQCLYKTCQHGNEPGCAVKRALRAGTVTQAHVANYQKMYRELMGLESRHITRVRQDSGRLHKASRRHSLDKSRDSYDEMNYT